MTDVMTKRDPHASDGHAKMDLGSPAASTSVAAPAQDNPRVHAYAELFDRVESTTEPQWLRAIRRGAIERFGQLGFPTTKNEDWHFTSVAPITAHEFTVLADAPATVTAETLAPFLFAGDWDVYVLVDGVLTPSLSAAFRDEKGLVVASLAEACADARVKYAAELEPRLAGLAVYQTDTFTALNTAFHRDGLYVNVAANVQAPRPIHIVHVTTSRAAGGLFSPRHIIVTGANAEVTVLESYVSVGDTGPSFTNAVSEVYVASGAKVRHYKIQRESLVSYHVASVFAHQERDSNYESFSFAVGADLSRTNISTVLDGPGAHATVNGLYMVGGRQTVDHQTRIEHAQERCTSHEVYKGVLDGESHAVFNGKVYVRPEAQQTDGKQSNNNLLLSDRARIDTKPQLEIFADDVKCTHGATIGRLDTTSLFYLKSRGIAADTARKLLTYAFAADVLEELTIDAVREQLESIVFDRFDIGK